MTDKLRRDFSWLWAAGATSLLLTMGGLIYQVRVNSDDIKELRDRGSPVLKARLDVIDSQAITQQKQIDTLTLDVKVELKEIRKLLEDHMKSKP